MHVPFHASSELVTPAKMSAPAMPDNGAEEEGSRAAFSAPTPALLSEAAFNITDIDAKPVTEGLEGGKLGGMLSSIAGGIGGGGTSSPETTAPANATGANALSAAWSTILVWSHEQSSGSSGSSCFGLAQ